MDNNVEIKGIATKKETWLSEDICLSVDTQGDRLRVVLKNKTGQEFVVNDELPDGWKIKQGTEKGTTYGKDGIGNEVHERSWTMEFGTKTFYFGEVLGTQDILSILHEVGHVKEIKETEYDEISKLGREAHSARLGGYEDDILKTNLAYAEAESAMEIKCWKYAEKEIEVVCQKLGVKMSDIFATREDLVNYINESLNTLSKRFQVNPYLEDDDLVIIQKKYLY